MSAGPVEVEADFAVRIATAAGAGVSVGELTVMPGGHSGLTHRAVLHGLPGHEAVVVKSTPPGRRPVGRHDVLRQARLIGALAAVDGVPVAELCFCDATPPPFFATGLAPGEAVDPVIPEVEVQLTAELVAARWETAIGMLGALHALDPGALHIDTGPARSPAAELQMWCKTMGAARMDDDAGFVRLREAMRREIPPGERPAIVHGDFRLGNILFDGPRASALIDWEIWSVGDPLVDVGWFVQFTDGDNFPGIGRDVPGTPSAGEVLERYRTASGDPRGTAETDWFMALGCLKLAAIQAHNRRRHLDGRFHDPFQALLGPSIERHLQRGIEILSSSLR
jgi:aminoglycoside phosphotransferase (APT) family kinase protein